MYGKSMAHVEQIVKVYPIEGADSVEMAQVLDWHVVVRKNQFKVGDLAVYVEMDSIFPDTLPEEHREEMNRLVNELTKLNRNRNKNKVEIETVKARIEELKQFNPLPATEILRSRKFKVRCVNYVVFNIISQGILFNISELLSQYNYYDVGQDVTDVLGIKQIIEDPEEAGVYEEAKINNPILRSIHKKLMKYNLYRKFRKVFIEVDSNWLPFFPSKSDEKNAQAVFTRMKQLHGDKIWVVTEKLEGQNISAHIRFFRFFGGLLTLSKFGVCSHVRSIPKGERSQFWGTINRLDYKSKMAKIGRNLFFRGEHIGNKIQKNVYKLTETDVYLFDVYDIDTKELMSYDEMKQLCSDNGFKMVPVIDENFRLPETVGELLEYSNGMSALNSNTRREGIVIRLRDNPKVSFKVRSPIYLAEWDNM
jgi:hypothetical protein